MPEPINTAWSDASLGAAVARINLVAIAASLDLASMLQKVVIEAIEAGDTFPQFTRRLDRVMLGGLRIGARHG